MRTQISNSTPTPKRSRLFAALGLALFCSTGFTAEHQLTKNNYDAARGVHVLDMVMSLDWDIDNPPEGRDKAFILGIAQQASKSLFTMTEGKQMLGKLYVYKNSQFMDNTDIQYLLKNGRANAHISGFQKFKSGHVQQFAGTGETPAEHGKTVAHEFGHYVLGLYDEYREAGGTSTEAGSPQDGDTPRDTMMHNHLGFATLSTASDYPDDSVKKTAHFRVFGKSAWEVLTQPVANDPAGQARVEFEAFIKMSAPTAATLTKPTTGWENDLQVVYMGADATAAPSGSDRMRPHAVTTASGPINVIVIDTAVTPVQLAAQLNAAAQVVDSAGSRNRVMVYAHPFSYAAAVPLTLLSDDATRKSVKAKIAAIAADTSLDTRVVGDRLLDFAETLVPALLPAGATTTAGGGGFYRIYSTGKAAGIGRFDGATVDSLYFYDGVTLANLGPAASFLPQARKTLSASLQTVLDNLKSVKKLSDTPAVTLFTTATKTVDSSVSTGFRNANVAVNAVALSFKTATASAPRFRAQAAGQTSLFDMAKETFGQFKEATKASDLNRAAGQASNAAEGDSVQTISASEIETLAVGATNSLTSTVAAGGLDKETTFTAFFSDEDEGKLEYTLTTPSGTVVTPTTLPAGITYKAEAGEGEVSYTVSAGFAGLAGNWTSKVKATAELAEGVYLEVAANSPLSATVDVTGGTLADPKPLSLEVEVSGPIPVSGATVTVDVHDASTGAVVRSGLVMRDDGVAPDFKKDDGKYAISLADLPIGEYEVLVNAKSTGAAVYTTSGSTKQGVNAPAEVVPNFQRVSTEYINKEK